MNVDVEQDVAASLNNNSQFDQYGRCLPRNIKGAAHEESRRYFKLAEQELDYEKIYSRLNTNFSIKDAVSVQDFKLRVEAILQKVSNNPELQPMLNGVFVPFILPKADYNDIGTAMEDIYLPAVGQSFNDAFPDYDFTNHSPVSLKQQFTIEQTGRHQHLIDTMKTDVVVGVYFPCLLEYSVPAARERMASLPDECLLAGGYDTAAAFVAAPNLLLREDGYPPLLWLSGLESDSENAEFHFEAYGYDLTFNRRAHNDHVAEYWASGLTLLG